MFSGSETFWSLFVRKGQERTATIERSLSNICIILLSRNAMSKNHQSYFLEHSKNLNYFSDQFSMPNNEKSPTDLYENEGDFIMKLNVTIFIVCRSTELVFLVSFTGLMSRMSKQKTSKIIVMYL